MQAKHLGLLLVAIVSAVAVSMQVFIQSTVATQVIWRHLNTNGRAPANRAHHSMASVGNTLYVVGGSRTEHNDTAIYNVDKNEWQWQQETHLPAALKCADMDASGGMLYIFGGRLNKEKKKNEGLTNNLYILRTPTRSEWKDLHLIDAPSERDAHTATAIAGVVYIFGGWDQKESYFNDLYAFDLTMLDLHTPTDPPLRWFELLTYGKKPEPRNSHTSVAVGSSMYVFGGFWHHIDSLGVWTDCKSAGDSCKIFNDLWVLRTPSKMEAYTKDQKSLRWSLIEPEGKLRPAKRWWHSAAAVGGRMYIFGGLGDTTGRGMFNDLWEYSIRVNRWTRLEDLPEIGLYAASMTSIGDTLYVFGGYTLDRYQGETGALWRAHLVEDERKVSVVGHKNIIRVPPFSGWLSFSITASLIVNIILLIGGVFVVRRRYSEVGYSEIALGSP